MFLVCCFFESSNRKTHTIQYTDSGYFGILYKQTISVKQEKKKMANFLVKVLLAITLFIF